MKNGYKYKNSSWLSCLWNASWPVLFYFVLNVVISIIFVFIIAFSMGVSGELQDPNQLVDAVYKYIIPVNIVIQVMCIALYLPMFIHEKKSYPVVKEKPLWHSVITGGLFVMMVGSLSSIILTFLDTHFNIFSDYYSNLTDVLSSSVFMMVLTTVILAPVMEELLVRGLILNRLLSKMDEWPAILISALIFGVIHLNLLQGVNGFIIGVALAFVYVKTRSIWPCIFGHFINNLLSTIEVIFDMSVSSVYVFEGILAVIGLIATVIFFKNKMAEIEK